MGSPAFDANKYRKAYIHFRNLDSLVQRVDKIEKLQKEIGMRLLHPNTDPGRRTRKASPPKAPPQLEGTGPKNDTTDGGVKKGVKEPQKREEPVPNCIPCYYRNSNICSRYRYEW